MAQPTFGMRNALGIFFVYQPGAREAAGDATGGLQRKCIELPRFCVTYNNGGKLVGGNDILIWQVMALEVQYDTAASALSP